ncbi:family 1 glycosylhydrolase [Nocardia tengchongensis]|uniref:family 1 glycosylhydrolase n=1 Tax=Nocardia tengchongensis TaxID=2055889 RepID=UPI003678E28D
MAAGAAAGLAGRADASARPAPPPTVPALGDDFLWGVAMNGFQNEGHTPDSNQFRFMMQRTVELPDHPDSVDFFTHYPADIGLAGGLGARVFSTTIEWARVQPRPGEWDEAGFGFYDRVLDVLAVQGIRPMLVLNQWVHPGWAADRGGWRNPGMVADWLANARTVVRRYADRNPLWVTFGEVGNYVKYEWEDGALDIAEMPVMHERLAQAHNEIYDYIHQVQPGAMVGVSVPFSAGLTESVYNLPVIDRIAGRLDFIGIVQAYTFTPGSLLAQSPLQLSSPVGHLIQPESIYYALDFYARRFPGTPLYVTGNGMFLIDGQARADGYTSADHLRDTAYWLQRAKADGIDVIGYNRWGLTDTFEWGTYALRFGLYSVDVRTDPTLTRHPTPAVDAYRTLIRDGGVPTDYRPVRALVDCNLAETPVSCTDPVTVPR